MIQDIFPYKLDNAYKPEKKAGEEDFVLCFDKADVCVKEEGLEFPKAGLIEASEREKLTYLFSVGGEHFFLAEKELLAEQDGYTFLSVRELRGEKSIPKHRRFAALTGKHLNDWYRDTKFCGRCGEKMVHSKTERAMCCPACNYTAYPRIMPAVIVGVIHGDELLLTKYRTGFAHNALVAGFTEIGETLEETVAREVMEEAGLKVKNIRYYKSQPWGIANDILMGFFCEVDGDTTITMDESELKMAEFTKREDIVLQPDDASLTNEMMSIFKDGKE